MRDEDFYNLILDVIELAREHKRQLADASAPRGDCPIIKRLRQGMNTIAYEADLRLREGRLAWLRTERVA